MVLTCDTACRTARYFQESFKAGVGVRQDHGGEGWFAMRFDGAVGEKRL
jgi:hypothetical protein